MISVQTNSCYDEKRLSQSAVETPMKNDLPNESNLQLIIKIIKFIKLIELKRYEMHFVGFPFFTKNISVCFHISALLYSRVRFYHEKLYEIRVP